jgi:hypothetical protein
MSTSTIPGVPKRPDAIMAEIETIEAEVAMVQTCVRDEGRRISACERDYLDELLLERADLYRSLRRAAPIEIEPDRLQSLRDTLQRESAVSQMQFGVLAVASGGMLTAMTSPELSSGGVLLVLCGGIALGGVRFARGLTAYFRR